MRTAALLLFVFLSQIVPVRCQTTATWATQAESHRGKNGQRIAFVCPPNGVISSRVWGTDLYTDDSSICSCAVHAGLITAARGGVVTIQIEPSSSSYRGSVRNGVTSLDYGYYAGSFRFVGQAVAIDQTAPMIDWGTAAQAMRGQNEQVFRFTCPSNGKITTRVWGTDLYTDDSSICTCAVHAGMISLFNGGEVAIRIKPGASSYAGSTRNGVTTTAYGAYSGSYEFVGRGRVTEPIKTPVPTPTASAKAIDWGTTAQSTRGQTEQVFRFTCPPNGKITTSVWGTDLYTDDSSICTCAVHAGIISVVNGGEVAIRVKPGGSSYAGSTRNGVTTRAYGAYSGSYEFVGRGRVTEPIKTPVPTPTASARAIDWGTAAQAMRGQNEQVFRFTCPSNGKITTRVWGTDLYTDDSSICTCAVHAGIISAVNGGEVAIRIKPGASSYAGSARNGVTTTAYGAYSGSYEFVSSGGQGGRGRPATGTRYRVENLVFNRPDVYQNPRNYHDFLIDFANGTVSEVNQETEQGRERIDILVFRPNRRVTIKTTNLTTGYWVEYDWVFQDDGRTIAGAWRDPGAWGPSVGGLSR